MRILLALILAVIGACNERFQDTATNSFVILIVYLSSLLVIVIPLAWGAFKIKRTIDREREELMMDEAAFDLPGKDLKRTKVHADSRMPEMSEIPSFKAWFALLERRIAVK